MRHIIIGGLGFTGRYLAKKLIKTNNKVVVCDVQDIPGKNVLEEAEYIQVDIRDKQELRKIAIDNSDIVYHLAARQYHRSVPYFLRENYFKEVNCQGTKNILEYMKENHCKKMIYISTDMVYGVPEVVPMPTDHKQIPLGPYGKSMVLSEIICRDYRSKGLNITILRPRLIIGPGRPDVLRKLFLFIENGWPVPLIGSGVNYYQMISVYDCVDAIIASVTKGVPNEEFNLGSKNPPTVEALLTYLIQAVDSKSVIIKTPGLAVKYLLGLLDRVGMTLLYKEQYKIADRTGLLDISKTEELLDWSPKHHDKDMILSAYNEYKLCV